MSSAAPQRKVVAATTGAGAGAIIGAALVGVLDDHVFDPAVTGSVPAYWVALIMWGVPALLAFAAGYLQPAETAGEHRADG